MSYASVFVDALKSFNGADFTEEQLKQKMEQAIDDNHLFRSYFTAYRNEPITGVQISGPAGGPYNVVVEERLSRRRHGTDGGEGAVPEHFRQAVESKLIEAIYEKVEGKEFKRISAYKICDFNKKRIIGEEALKFFVYTYAFYKRLIDKHVSDPFVCENLSDPLKAYLSPTDCALLNPDNTLSESEFIFKEFVYHSQNRRGGIPKFLENEAAIKKYLCKYNVEKYYKYIDGKDLDSEASKLAGIIKCTKAQARSFLNSAKATCCYLKNKMAGPSSESLHDRIKNDFINYVPNPQELFNKFREKLGEGSGFGEALVFDVLKEFDRAFDLPKPDLHVKRVMVALFCDSDEKKQLFIDGPSKLSPETIPTLFGDNNAMDLYLDLMRNINACPTIGKLKLPRPIPNYVLDKMIYLICSGKLYLQKRRASGKAIQDTKLKDSYLKGILNGDYLKTSLSSSDLNGILDYIF